MSILFDKQVTNGHQFHPWTLPARPAIEMWYGRLQAWYEALAKTLIGCIYGDYDLSLVQVPGMQFLQYSLML